MTEDIDWGSRISKMKRGDKVLVNLISEPLQEKYIALKKMGDESKEAINKAKALYNDPEDMPIELAEELQTMERNRQVARDQFWWDLHVQYKLWKIGSMSLRNGFVLVKTVGPEDVFKRLNQVMKDFTEEMGLDEEDNG